MASCGHCDSSTTMKDLVPRNFTQIGYCTCETYCLTLIKSKLLAGSYDSCFTHLLLRVWGRLARFIYWLLLNHFFLPVYAGVYLPHTIKSAVFLLYFTCFLWKTLHKVNIIKGLQYCRVLSNNHGFVTPLKVHIAMLLLCPHADLLLLQKRIRSLLLGIGN